MCHPGGGVERVLFDVRVAPGELELDAGRTPARVLVGEVWRSRQLVRILARKNFYVKYRRAALGMLWVVGLPLAQASVMAVIFSRFRTGEAPGGNFGAYVLSGYLVWNFFSTVVSGGATAIVDSSALSSRIYFPRALLPIITVVSNLYGFGATVAVISGIALVLRGEVEPTLPLLLPAVALVIALAGALSLVLSALHVYARDIRYVVTAVMQPWFFLTPVLWSSALLPDGLARVLRYNPAAGPIELAHLAVVGEAGEGWEISVAACVVTTVLLCVAALRLHTRFDRLFADLL